MNIKIRNAILGIVLIIIVASGIFYYYANTPKPGTISSEQQARLDTMYVAYQDPTLSLHPHYRQAQAYFFLKEVYETLVKYDGADPNTVKPGLATSWEVSSDGKVYTFHLRQGVKFFDGDTFDANSVKYTMDMVKLVGQDGRYGAFYINPPAYDHTEVVDQYTAKIYLNRVVPYFLAVVAHPSFGSMLNPKWVDAHGGMGQPGKVNHGLDNVTDGTGPYNLDPTSYVVGDRFTLVQNPNYWGGWTGNHLKKIVVRYIPEVTTKLLLLGRGDLDFGYVPPQYLPELKSRIKSENLPLKITETDAAGNPLAPVLTIHTIDLSEKILPFSDLHMRKAAAYAFDYDQLISKVLFGYGNRAVGQIPRGTPFFNPNMPSYSFDLDKAKAEFALASPTAQAAAAKGVRFIYQQGLGIDTPGALLLQSSWAKVGIKVTPFAADFNAWFDSRKSGTSFETIDTLWTTDYNDPANHMVQYISDISRYYVGPGMGFGNKTIDSWYDLAGSTPDPAVRQQNYDKMQMWIYQNVTRMFTFQNSGVDNAYNVQNINLQGFVYNPVYSLTPVFYKMYKTPTVTTKTAGMINDNPFWFALFTIGKWEFSLS